MFVVVLRYLTRNGIKRGLKGSRFAMTIGVAAGGLNIMRYLVQDKPQVLYRTRVRSGDRFVMTAKEPK
jgi:hypothetical protein